MSHERGTQAPPEQVTLEILANAPRIGAQLGAGLCVVLLPAGSSTHTLSRSVYRVALTGNAMLPLKPLLLQII